MINPNSIIGKHCIIKSGEVIEHDNHIEDYVHISVVANWLGRFVSAKVLGLELVQASAIIILFAAIV